MTEIDRMNRYIDRTKPDKNGRFCMRWPETLALVRSIKATGDPYTAVVLAYNYGKAKGYRAAKSEVRK